MASNYKVEYIPELNILLVDSSDTFFYIIYFYENHYEAYELNLMNSKYKLSAKYEFGEYLRVFFKSLIKDNFIKSVCKLKLRSSASDKFCPRIVKGHSNL